MRLSAWTQLSSSSPLQPAIAASSYLARLVPARRGGQPGVNYLRLCRGRRGWSARPCAFRAIYCPLKRSAFTAF